MAEKASETIERFNGIYKDLMALNAIDDRNEQQHEEMRRLLAEYNELRPKVELIRDAEKAEAEMRRIAQSDGPKAARHRVPGTDEPEDRIDRGGIGKRFTESTYYKNFMGTGDYRGAGVPVKSFFRDFTVPEQRAVVTAAGLPADMVRPDIVPGIFRGDEQIGSIRGALLNGQTGSDSVTFFRELLFTNAAAEVAEGAVKAESTITFEQATAPVQVIAHTIPVNNQIMWDASQVQTYIEGRLIDGLARREAAQLLNGNGTGANILGLTATTGVQALNAAYFTGSPVVHVGAGGPENFERVLRGKTLVRTVGGGMASFVMINSADFEKFQTIGDTTKQYYGVAPFSAGMPRLWGMPVIESDYLTAGTVLVGDGRFAGVWDRMSATVRIGEVNDQFVRNQLTLLAEERIALTVYRPAAFALVTLAAF